MDILWNHTTELTKMSSSRTDLMGLSQTGIIDSNPSALMNIFQVLLATV